MKQIWLMILNTDTIGELEYGAMSTYEKLEEFCKSMLYLVEWEDDETAKIYTFPSHNRIGLVRQITLDQGIAGLRTRFVACIRRMGGLSRRKKQ